MIEPVHTPVPITPDNIHLSEPTPNTGAEAFDADCNPHHAADAKVLDFLQAARAPNTRRAYQFDLEHFLVWGGDIPSTDVQVARYLADQAGRLAIATLTRRLVAIRQAHVARKLPDPTSSELVRLTFRGICRKLGQPQRRVAALSVDDLRAIIATLGPSARDIRDAAILLVGFFGAFRRTELAAIDCNDVAQASGGLVIQIRRSKTDQNGHGRKIVIPRGHGALCPVCALERWIALSASTQGPIFRPVTRGGRVLPTRLSPEAIALIVKQRVHTIGQDASRYSGHSLRAGFATAAASAGLPLWRIKTQTGHISDAVLGRYIREVVSDRDELKVLFER